MILAALRGNSGKTLVSVGLGSYFNKQGKKVAVYKKGPDYIDAAWLELATGHTCYNLDTFLMGEEGVLARVHGSRKEFDLFLIEGNRGIFDGYDNKGSYSTAELSKLLNIPVVLIVDCSMATRTIAAMVLGCQQFDPDVVIKGVILNRIAGKRHKNVITSVIEDRCRIPVLGAVPRIKGLLFPERHMGLISPYEYSKAEETLDNAAEIVEKYLNIEKIYELAHFSDTREIVSSNPFKSFDCTDDLETISKPRIGFIKDSAFWFYYCDNLEALEKCGADLVECNALNMDKLPQLDALYIGGGFPETHAESLSGNTGFRESLYEYIENGLPVYAECGGLVYLGENLVTGDKTYPMVGTLPLTFTLHEKPQGHGYTILKVDQQNHFFKTGSILNGHEFHYTQVSNSEEVNKLKTVFNLKKGYGITGKRDGIIYKNLFATYSHLHALGTKDWAKGLYKQAVLYHQKKQNNEIGY